MEYADVFLRSYRLNDEVGWDRKDSNQYRASRIASRVEKDQKVRNDVLSRTSLNRTKVETRDSIVSSDMFSAGLTSFIASNGFH